MTNVMAYVAIGLSVLSLVITIGSRLWLRRVKIKAGWYDR